jgi:AcrR family transcriptional regulator
MTPARRMGPKGSEIWHAMLDAAEKIMQDQGYGKLTSRSVAERIGVKQRLVYYYFSTMDELIVEAFRRAAAREIARLGLALTSEHSIREIWKVFIETTDTKLVSEFVALSHRIDALGKEVKAHIEECRKLQVHALEQAMAANRIEPIIPPIAATIFANAAMLTLHHEVGIGVRDGHDEVLKVIADFIGLYDPAD